MDSVLRFRCDTPLDGPTLGSVLQLVGQSRPCLESLQLVTGEKFVQWAELIEMVRETNALKHLQLKCPSDRGMAWVDDAAEAGHDIGAVLAANDTLEDLRFVNYESVDMPVFGGSKGAVSGGGPLMFRTSGGMQAFIKKIEDNCSLRVLHFGSVEYMEFHNWNETIPKLASNCTLREVVIWGEEDFDGAMKYVDRYDDCSSDVWVRFVEDKIRGCLKLHPLLKRARVVANTCSAVRVHELPAHWKIGWHPSGSERKLCPIQAFRKESRLDDGSSTDRGSSHSEAAFGHVYGYAHKPQTS